MTPELPPLWLIIIEIAVGAILGKILAPINQAIIGASSLGFVVGVWQYLFVLNPQPTTDVNVLSNEITTVVTALVTFVPHIAFFDIGSVIVNRIFNQDQSSSF